MKTIIVWGKATASNLAVVFLCQKVSRKHTEIIITEKNMKQSLLKKHKIIITEKTWNNCKRKYVNDENIRIALTVDKRWIKYEAISRRVWRKYEKSKNKIIHVFENKSEETSKIKECLHINTLTLNRLDYRINLKKGWRYTDNRQEQSKK